MPFTRVCVAESEETGDKLWVKAYAGTGGRNGDANRVTEFDFIDDWARSKLSRETHGALFQAPASPDRKRWMETNVKACENFLTKENALHTYAGKYAGRTCVMVCPGPSSKGIVERLAPFRDSIDVCAINRAGMYEGLDPKWFGTVEVHTPPEWHEKIDPMKVTLLATPIVDAAVHRRWNGSNCLYAYLRDCGNPAFPPYKDLGMVVGAYTVSTVLLHMLAVLGYSRILMVGVDLACGDVELSASKDGGSNLKGEVYGDGKTMEGTYFEGCMMFRAVGLDGNECFTNSMFLSQRTGLECQMETAWEAGIEVYNCSGRGILDYRVGDLETLLRSRK